VYDRIAGGMLRKSFVTIGVLALLGCQQSGNSVSDDGLGASLTSINLLRHTANGSMLRISGEVVNMNANAICFEGSNRFPVGILPESTTTELKYQSPELGVRALGTELSVPGARDNGSSAPRTFEVGPDQAFSFELEVQLPLGGTLADQSTGEYVRAYSENDPLEIYLVQFIYPCVATANGQVSRLSDEALIQSSDFISLP
jgi:hypothetical protein